MKATGHTCCKLVFTNTEQQGKQRIRSKNTDEYCSKNRWWSSLHERKPNKIGPIPNTETFLQQTQLQSQRKLMLSYVLIQFFAGVRRGRIGQGNALWNARPKMWMCLAACELPFYKGALCAFNLTLWQLQDGDGWWSSKFFWRAFGTEHACESPRHGSPQAGLFLSSVHVVLSFVLHFKELRN